MRRGSPVVVLSGPVGAGKTTLAEALVNKLGFKRLFTRDAILRRLPDTARARLDLQAAGERLDRDTGGSWVAHELRQLIAEIPAPQGVVVDAVLIAAQVEAIRTAAKGRVIHVHLTAPRQELEIRYANKRGGIKESESYADLLQSPTEASVGKLGQLADAIVDTSETLLQDEVDLVVSRLDRAQK